MNGLQLIEAAVARWIDGEGTRSTYGLCQQFDGWYVSRVQQPPGALIAYPSAKRAYQASDIFTRNVNSSLIEPGDSLYYDYGVYGHVITAIGRDLRTGRVLASQTANKGTVIRRLRRNVKIVYADSIGLPFLGASHRNGRNPRRAGITAWNIGILSGGDASLPEIPLTGQEDTMVFVRAAGDTKIYEISQGKRHYLAPNAWKAIKLAYAAAGMKVPYSAGRMTKAQVASIPAGN